MWQVTPVVVTLFYVDFPLEHADGMEFGVERIPSVNVSEKYCDSLNTHFFVCQGCV